MTTATISYSSAAALTITLASLATSTTAAGVGRQSTVVDNTSDLYIDAILGGKITVGTTPTANSQIEIWAFGSYDGTSYTGGAGASDAGLTLIPAKRYQLALLTIILVPTTTSNVAFLWGPVSIANAFGGVLPPKWGVYVLNSSGVNLHATAGNHEIKFEGIKFLSA